MSDKSNKYGYVGVDIPAQSFGSNKGVFYPAEINDLVANNQWTTFGQLELIETQTATSGDSAMDFLTLGDYNVHFLTCSNYKSDTDGAILDIRVSDDGGSTFKSAGYQYAYQKGQADGTFSEVKSTSSSRIAFASGESGTASNEIGSGYVYLYNLLDSSKYSFATSHIIANDNTPVFETRFGSGVYPTSATHNAIRLLASTGNLTSLTASLYGIRYS